MKKILLMLAICLSATFMTSCEEIIQKTYYMSPGDMNANCVANLYLQKLIFQNVNTQDSSMPVTFFGEEEDAITWFDKKCKEFVDPSFTKDNDVKVVGETWMDMKLLDMGDQNRVVKTTRLLFPENL